MPPFSPEITALLSKLKVGRPSPTPSPFGNLFGGGGSFSTPSGGGFGSLLPQQSQQELQQQIQHQNAATQNAPAIAQLSKEAKGIGEFAKISGDSKSVKQLNAINERIMQLGGDPVIPSAHKKSVFDKFVDVIQRPENAVMSMFSTMGTTATQNSPNHGTKFSLKALGKGIEAMPGGFWAGLSGKNKETGASLIQKSADQDFAAKHNLPLKHVPYGTAHVNPWVKGVGGLGLDLALDPLTYTGFGLATKIPEETAVQAAKSADLVRAITKGSDLTSEERAILEGGNFIGASAAAKSAAFAKLQPLLKHLADHAELTVPEQGIKEAIQGVHAGGNLSKAAIDLRTSRAVNKAKQVARNDAIAPLVENFWKTADSPLTKQLGIRISKDRTLTKLGSIQSKGAMLAIPGSQHVGSALSAATHIDPVSKVIHGFRDRMQVSYKVPHEIHSAGSALHGETAQAIRIVGQKYDKVFGKLTQTQRKAVLQDVLHGVPIVGHPHEAAAQLIHKELSDLNSYVKDPLGEGTAVAHNDLNKWLPKDMHFKQDMIPKMQGAKPIYNRAGNIAKEKDPNWFLNSIKNSGIEHDPAQLLLHLQTAHLKALALRAFKESAVHSMGVAADARKAKQMAAQGWTTSKHIGADTLFHSEVAQGLDRMLTHMTDFGQIGKFGHAVQRLTNPIKTMLTKYSPGFHERNFLTDLALAATHGTMPSDIRKAMSLMVHRGHNFEGENPLLLIPGNSLRNARHSQYIDKVKGSGRIQNTMRLRSADGKVHPFISESELYAGAHKNGIFQTHTGLEFSHPAFKENPVLKPFHAFSQGVTNMSDTREGIMRMARFMKEVRTAPKGASLEEVMAKAGAEVRKWHVDYADLTKFERNTMRNIFPFYSWTRKNIPLMMEVLATKPGAVSVVPKLERAMAEMSGYDTPNTAFPAGMDAIVPGWMKDAGMVPVGPQDKKHGNWYASIPNPFTDILNQTVSPMGSGPSGITQVLGGAVNPLFKIPYELSTLQDGKGGHQLYSGIPLKTKNNPLWQYLVSQVPQGRVAVQTNKGNFSSLANFLTGLYTAQNTPKRQQGELIQELIKAQAEKKKLEDAYKKKHHIPANARMGKYGYSTGGGYGFPKR
jgi:hypothetical protein